MNNEIYQRTFKALGDPTRLHILQFLASTCCGTASVDEEETNGSTAGEICCHVTGADKISSTVSHHLHELEEAGLIGIERKGKSMVCSLKQDSIKSAGEFLIHISQGGHCQCGCCEGKPCTCEPGKCNCQAQAKCDCGCQEGKPCTCCGAA